MFTHRASIRQLEGHFFVNTYSLENARALVLSQFNRELLISNRKSFLFHTIDEIFLRLHKRPADVILSTNFSVRITGKTAVLSHKMFYAKKSDT
jgi:hypothetical protein